MTGSLQVNPGELRSAGTSFTGVADKLVSLDPGTPLADAAAAVPGLKTAGACLTAKESVAQQMIAITSAARTFGGNLTSAADKYESTDQASGGNIAGVPMPAPGG
ncbi:type VII secretion target [Mycobacterium kyogaense]|uniref:type VII secretion target n=1 Tax=Mycobacterium kyogaense TaxID=2212479 RepID=UPI000DAE56F6|nr:type VII secretion target [Mycobacterium kyogaense]